MIIDLMDAIRPKSINYENVREGGNEEVIFVTVSFLHALFLKMVKLSLVNKFLFIKPKY